MTTRKQRIAILGTRGIPANYSGYETFVEELGTRLAAKGHDVTVYCRKGSVQCAEPFYKGVRLVQLPTIRHKYLDTIAHTLISTFHVIFRKTDVIYYCNTINSAMMIVPRLFFKKTIMNVDGLEWKRTKWNALGKLGYRVSEFLATVLAHEIVSDSRRIQLYYKKKFGRDTNYLTYGANGGDYSDRQETLAQYGLTRRGYLLYVSRLEPENNAHIIIAAYEKVKTDLPLIIVGGAPYGKPYIDQLRATKDPRIKFLGSIFGDHYKVLVNNSYLFFHGNGVGGTNPGLVEALALGGCVVANGVGFNREVVGNAGVWFKPGNVEDLRRKIERLLANPAEVESYRPLAVERVKKHYNWDAIAGEYEQFFDYLTDRQYGSNKKNPPFGFDRIRKQGHTKP